ncbi:MAG: PKD domain-containing protein [Bacteroidetes bacterium]|nr:PKD domain-containing protein [Bacteroidota bacterium]
MFKQTLQIFLLLLCLNAFESRSQIVVSPTLGCVPLSGVNYSGPAGATGIIWNFGDGITSNQATPTHNYTSSGNFIVTYNATVGGSPVTYTALVKVFPKPNVNFTFAQPLSGCAVKTVSFTDQSTGGGGTPITGWNWTFGDGGSNNSAANPLYGYSIAGSFSVTLKVTDANGCDNTLTLGTINVSAPPTVVIGSIPSPLNSCVAPFTPTFNGSGCVSNSPTGGGLTYNWNFGNSQTSTLQNPGATTYPLGNYNVTLTVTDNNNCKASTTVPVTVSQPSVLATVPGTVCYGLPLYVTDQSNVPFTFWNMGDGSTYNIPTSAASQSIHIYPNPGVYTINITAYSGTCQATATKTILVQQVVANFSFTPPSYTCSPTMIANYTNLSSSNAVSFTWTASNYNGGSTSLSNATNPTFTLVQGSLNPYTIYTTFSSNVTLIAKSAFGCISTQTVHVFDSIRRPTAWFNKDKKEGCAPLTVKFRDSSFTNTTIYPITSYTWNNGATPAQLVTGTIPPPMVNPAFTYTAAGTYFPYLIIKTATGCIDTSFIDTVHVANPPNVSIVFSPSVACWNTPIQTTLSTIPASTPAVQHWHVDADNGFFSGCVSDPNPQWNFTHTGVHTFSVSGYLYSCKGTNTSTASVTIKGPIAQSRFETNCTARKTVNFYSNLDDVQNATLNFGDNSSVAIAGVPGSVIAHSVAHTYSATGNYTAVLTASNTANLCGPYTYTMLVKVRDAVASFTMPAVACASVAQTFNGSSSQDVSIGCERGYVWYIDTYPPIDTTSAIYSIGFSTPGTHTVTLMVKDENSCADTTTKTFRISSATPSFSFSSNPICLSTGTVNLINTTTQPPPDFITGYAWNFGDGSTSTSSVSPLTHAYTSANIPSQTYTVSLSATNNQGCTDIVTHTIQVNNPSASLNINPLLPCVGTPVSFNAPTGYTSYTFNFGAGSSPLTTSTNTASYTYTSGGIYTASLSVQSGACLSSSSSTVSVQAYPVANFGFSSAGATSTNNICTGSPVTFTSTSISTNSLNYTWNLGNGSPIINSATVVNTYTNVGQVSISLTVTTMPNGCAATITKTLSLYGAKANLNLNKLTVCLGNAINFNVKDSSTVLAWQWDFGDGTTSSTITANPPPPGVLPHVYSYYPLPNGTTTVSLIYYSSNYACKYSATQQIQIIKINTDFKRNLESIPIDSVHCINIPDLFTNITPGSAGYNFNWGFGDGGTSTAQNPSYTYPLPGAYQVTLTVVDPVNNCMGLTTKNMTINALPLVSILGPDSVCKGAPFNLNSSTSPNVTGYTWTPASMVTSPNTPSTSATATVLPTSFSLQVTDANGCKNSAIKNVYVQGPPTNLAWDSTVIIGQIIPLNGYAGTNFNYTWTPGTSLSCTSCLYPVSNSTVDITYSVTIEDPQGCFKITNTYTIHVDPKATVDVPTAFTPNGDGTNDFINADGWGIKRLNYFRVYNRWGQLLFESYDIKVGWDGTYNGVPQNMETYIYQVSVDTYIDKEALLKTGSFKLIR